MLRFTHVELNNWRNFRQVSVALQERMVLVGPNASGKSNFLDALRFLFDVVSIGGGFQQAVHKRGGVSKLCCMAARASSDITVHVQIDDQDVGEGGQPALWDYTLLFNQDSQKRPQIKHEEVRHRGHTLLARPIEQDKQDRERLTQTYIEQVHANRDFRDLAEFLRALRYMHIVPQLVREPERSLTKADDPFGGDFLEQIAKSKVLIQQSRLRKITDALKIAIPQLQELKLNKDERGIPHLAAKYKHWRPQGMWLDEEQFSDGTLRLMGLLWVMLDGTGPLLLEEPELSLHPGVVRMLPQMFARLTALPDKSRQVLMSSHSNELLSDPGIGLDEVLVFKPGDEGTTVKLASDYPQLTALVGNDYSLADALLPLTEPDDIGRFPAFLGR